MGNSVYLVNGHILEVFSHCMFIFFAKLYSTIDVQRTKVRINNKEI